MKARTGLPGKYSQDNTATMGKPRLDSRPGQDCHERIAMNRTAKGGQPGRDSGQDRTGQAGKDCQEKTARIELPGQDWQDRAARAGLPGRNCLESTARTGLPGQVARIGKSGQDYRTGSQERTASQNKFARTEQPEQNSQERTDRTEQLGAGQPARTGPPGKRQPG